MMAIARVRLLCRVLIAGLACLAAPAVMAGSVELPLQIGGAYSVPVSSLKERHFAATIRQKYDFSCGSAALATLLTHHYRHRVSESQVFDEMFRLGDQEKIRSEGFSLLDMKRYLDAIGYQSDGFHESIDKLAAADIPAIVLINERGYNHFVVVKGVRDGRVLMGDPATGIRTVSQTEFESMWTSGILFVISNHRDSAVFNAAADWRTGPEAPLRNAINRDGLAGIVMPRLGPSDF